MAEILMKAPQQPSLCMRSESVTKNRIVINAAKSLTLQSLRVVMRMRRQLHGL